MMPYDARNYEGPGMKFKDMFPRAEKLCIVNICTAEKNAVVLVRAETEFEACCNAYFMLLLSMTEGCDTAHRAEHIWAFNKFNVKAYPAIPGILDYGNWD